MKRENIFIRILKWLGLIEEKPIDDVTREEMCKQAQQVCHHECESCAWMAEWDRNHQ